MPLRRCAAWRGGIKANQLDKAKGLYKQALKIAKSRFGKDHPNVLRALRGLDRCRVGNKETREN